LPRFVQEVRKKYGKLFNRLNRLELVDDTKFAKWWIEQRNTFKPRGKRALETELRIKGIKKDIRDEVLDSILIDEEKIATELLTEKAYKWKALPKREARQKKGQFLARKGFTWRVIEKILRSL
jgi:regulatory protein